jgi:hypothetical protein
MNLEFNRETGFVTCPECKGMWQDRNFWLVVSAQQAIKLLSSELEDAQSEIRSLSREIDSLRLKCF